MDTSIAEKLKICLSDYSGDILNPMDLIQPGNMIISKDNDIFIFSLSEDNQLIVKYLKAKTVSQALEIDKSVYDEDEEFQPPIININSGDTFYKNLNHIYCDTRNTQVYVKDDVLIEKDSSRVIQWCANSKMPPDNVIIGNYTFTFSSVSSLVIPSNVIDIEDLACIHALKLVDIEFKHQSCNLPSMVNCINLKTVKLEPNKIYQFETDSLLNGCISITDISWVNQVSFSTTKEAFCDCWSLTRVDISKSKINSIDEQTFYNCYNLSSVILPPTVTIIDELAFDSCKSLKTVVCPYVKVIKEDAFQECYALESLELSTVGQVEFSDTLFINRINSFKIKAPKETLDFIQAEKAEFLRAYNEL